MTDNGKIIRLNADEIRELADTGNCYFLSDKTQSILLSVLEFQRWMTRWTGTIDKDEVLAWVDRAAYELMTPCASVGMFDIRLDPEDACQVQKTFNGVDWINAFRLDGPCATSRIRRNPYTGDYGIDVEDVGFYRFPDGPWSESYPVGQAIPPARTEATDDDKLCAAAANAAQVLAETYRSIGETLLDVVAASDWDYVAAVGGWLTGVLLAIGASALQPHVAIASILGLVGVRQQYVDYPLTAEDVSRLQCILLTYATLQDGGSVTFDFQSVWNEIDLASPKNGLVSFLLTVLGGDPLNYAGSVDIVATPDCDECFDCPGGLDETTQTMYLLKGSGTLGGPDEPTVLNSVYTGEGSLQHRIRFGVIPTDLTRDDTAQRVLATVTASSINSLLWRGWSNANGAITGAVLDFATGSFSDPVDGLWRSAAGYELANETPFTVTIIWKNCASTGTDIPRT